MLYSIIISLAWPSRFDWREFLKIDLIEDKSVASSESPSTIAVNQIKDADNERKLAVETQATPTGFSALSHNSETSLANVVHPFDPETIRHIKKWRSIAVGYFIVNVLTTIVLWPLPLYRDWIFTNSFFGGWVTMSIIWQWLAIILVVIYPVYDGRHAIAKTVRGLRKDVEGGKRRTVDSEPK